MKQSLYMLLMEGLLNSARQTFQDDAALQISYSATTDVSHALRHSQHLTDGSFRQPEHSRSDGQSLVRQQWLEARIASHRIYG